MNNHGGRNLTFGPIRPDRLERAMIELRRAIDPAASKERARAALADKQARRKEIYDRGYNDGFEAGRASVKIAE